MSVYTLELIAVLQDLRYFNENTHKEENSVLIITDSRILIDLFRSFNTKFKTNNVVIENFHDTKKAKKMEFL